MLLAPHNCCALVGRRGGGDRPGSMQARDCLHLVSMSMSETFKGWCQQSIQQTRMEFRAEFWAKDTHLKPTGRKIAFKSMAEKRGKEVHGKRSPNMVDKCQASKILLQQLLKGSTSVLAVKHHGNRYTVGKGVLTAVV